MFRAFKLVILFILLALDNTAQIMVFTPESEKFLKEVQSYLGVYNKADAKEFIRVFEPVWMGGTITPDQKAQVYETANAITQKKLKTYPEFKNYMLSVMNFAVNARPNEVFIDWHDTFNEVLKNRDKKKISRFIETCSNLLNDNTIYLSTSKKWQANKATYKFHFKKEPYIVFDRMDLKCYSKNDSSVIKNTKGVYYPLSSKWFGDGGKLSWERALLPKDKVYADLATYRLSMKNAGFIADSVDFHSRYFEKPIKGKLSEKILTNLGPKKVKYPRFESYDKRLVIKNVFNDVDYDGGFTIQGANLLGSGSIDNLAKLIFKYDDKDFLIAEAINFTINEDEISSGKSKIKFYLENDSVTHPGLVFKYVNKTGKVTLIRGDRGIAASPYYNSYHKLDMFFEALYWKVGEAEMEFAPLFGSTDISARFDSHDFFDKNIYDQLTGMGTNPLVQIKNFAEQIGSDVFNASDLAVHMRRSTTDNQFLLYQLTTLGFIDYDDERKMVIVKEKLYNYIDARKAARDFDVIVINSTAKKNASLNLVNLDLNINGVERVNLSNSQHVSVRPSNQILTVKKNRDMFFGGLINSGRTQYFGNEFTFNYQDFKLNIIQCDSMLLWPFYKEKEGSFVQSLSIIEEIHGEILIDAPDNKCGLDTNKHDYPILKSINKTYVYYDDESIFEGLYSRDSFMFVLDTFSMDSLDNFTNEGLHFEGTFLSAGIFPEFREALTLQEDYSLGFIRETPESGFEIYGLIANYDNEIRLSHKGLQGSGSINYLTSHAQSDELTFFPDSVTAIAQTYTNTAQAEDPEVPIVVGKDCYVSYIPKDEVLYASSIKEDLTFFEDDDATLHGTLALTPEGMTGEGIMYFGKGEMLSYGYKYLYDAINADTSEFKLNTMEDQVKEMAFKTQNVNAHVDFTNRKGEFKSNAGESFVQFPDNMYICYMDQFNWYMDNDDLEMESGSTGDINIDTDLDLSGSNFFSVHPDQDSLNFKSPKARFDIKKKKIYCDKVEFIRVADARVFPDSGKVLIKKKAKIKTLVNAEIIANYVTKYHKIYDAKVDINARRDYVASGTIDYVDEDENKQQIYFSYIHLDTTFQTTAKGKIDDEATFTLSPHFEFHGDVEMFASVKDLSFNGETRIVHECDNIARNWIKFEGVVNPLEVYIPIDTIIIDTEGDPIGAGIILNTTDSISLYTTFLSKKSDASHKDLITANGYIFFNKKENEFQISNREKLAERSLPGNFISLNIINCKMEGDGQFDFGSSLGQVSLTPVGEIKYNPARSSTDIKSSVIIDFPYNEEAFNLLAKEIVEYPDLRSIDLVNSTYEVSLRELVGLKQSDKMISDLNIHGKVKKFPEELEQSIYLGDIRFRWDSDRKAYVSYGDLGIANFKKKQVMRYVKGKVVIFKRFTGDEITIYLELDSDNYYYFNYKRGLMQVFSSNEDYNTIILETKKDDTKFKGGKEGEDYQFMMGSKTVVTAFRRSYMEE